VHLGLALLMTLCRDGTWLRVTALSASAKQTAPWRKVDMLRAWQPNDAAFFEAGLSLSRLV